MSKKNTYQQAHHHLSSLLPPAVADCDYDVRNVLSWLEIVTDISLILIFFKKLFHLLLGEFPMILLLSDPLPILPIIRTKPVPVAPIAID